MTEEKKQETSDTAITLDKVENEAIDVLENTPARWLGMGSRIGYIAGLALSKGSIYVAHKVSQARLLAFSSDVGEAFRPIVDSKYVKIGYGVAIAYVLTDIGLTAHIAKRDGEDVVRETLQRSTFQLFGSLIIPSIVIHQGVHFAQKQFHKIGRYQKWGPVVVGLGLIPFMPVLIDEPVEHLVHHGFSHYWPKKPKQE